MIATNEKGLRKGPGHSMRVPGNSYGAVDVGRKLVSGKSFQNSRRITGKPEIIFLDEKKRALEQVGPGAPTQFCVG